MARDAPPKPAEAKKRRKKEAGSYTNRALAAEQVARQQVAESLVKAVAWCRENKKGVRKALIEDGPLPRDPRTLTVIIDVLHSRQ